MPGSNQNIPAQRFRRLWVTVIACGITAGSLDGLAAIIIYGPVFGRTSIQRIFQGIASGLFGHSAMLGGWRYTFYGILLHYLIATLFSAAYGIGYAQFSFLKKRWVRNGVLYGLFVWIIMNKLVLPLAGMPVSVSLSAMATGILILILCVGMPIAGITQFTFRDQIK
jgi:uncharacterized membrane protein YagU involved in acid resistance